MTTLCLIKVYRKDGINAVPHISPDKVSAVRAEGGLPEEGGHELVRVDLVHLPLHRAPPLPRHETPLLKQF